MKIQMKNSIVHIELSVDDFIWNTAGNQASKATAVFYKTLKVKNGVFLFPLNHIIG